MTVAELLKRCYKVYLNISIFYGYDSYTEEYENLNCYEVKEQIPDYLNNSKVDGWTFEGNCIYIYCDFNPSDDDLK